MRLLNEVMNGSPRSPQSIVPRSKAGTTAACGSSTILTDDASTPFWGRYATRADAVSAPRVGTEIVLPARSRAVRIGEFGATARIVLVSVEMYRPLAATIKTGAP